MLSRQCDRAHTFNRKQVSVGSCGCSSQMVCECNFSKPNPSGLFPLAEQRFLNLSKWYQLRIDFWLQSCMLLHEPVHDEKKNSESKPLNATTPVLQKWNLARENLSWVKNCLKLCFNFNYVMSWVFVWVRKCACLLPRG